MAPSESDSSHGEVTHLSYSGEFSLVDSVSLAASASFISAMSVPKNDNQLPCLDLAFPVEGLWRSVGVRVTQDGNRLDATIFSNADDVPSSRVEAQIKQMLGLDVDGNGFAAVAARDEVLGEQVKKRAGVRPVLFPSPYEAAARAIIGQRLFVRQAASVTASIATQYGEGIRVGGHVLHAFPAPEVLAKISTVPGLADRKIVQLRAVGVAAADGSLDRAHLRRLQLEEAIELLQRLPGIGPFSAELILFRGVGDPDAFPLQEKRLHRAMALLYKLGDAPSLQTLKTIAEAWRPYRSWAGLLLRYAIAK